MSIIKKTTNNPQTPAEQKGSSIQGKFIFNKKVFIDEFNSNKPLIKIFSEIGLILLSYLISNSIFITTLIFIATVLMFFTHLFAKQQPAKKNKIYSYTIGSLFTFSIVFIIILISYKPEFNHAFTI